MERRMNWRKLAIGTVAALMVPMTAFAQTLVVKSAGPSAAAYPPGHRIAPGASVMLRAGDSLTLLDNRGTRTLKGPGSFRTGATQTASADSESGVAALIGARRVTHARTGAVRGVIEDTTPARSPNLWYVDITKSQTACEPDPEGVMVWRPDIDSDAVYTVKSDKTGQHASVKFARGEAVENWPKALPVDDGAAYTLKGPGLAAPVQLTFAAVTKQQPDAEQVAATLIDHRCEAQLNLLVDTVPDISTPGA